MVPKNTPLPLSPKELRVLEFVEQFIENQGISPTFQEIKEHFGFASFNSVQRYLKQLQDKHYLRIPGGNQKRALQILHPSHSVSTSLQERISALAGRPQPQVPIPTTLQSKKGFPPSNSSRAEALSLPLLGRVAAGSPIEAFLQNEFVEVPTTLVRDPSKTYALSVEGQSMIEDGILDGDLILVQKQSYANNGDTVVAMVNNQATVKRFYLHRNSKPDIHSNPQSDAQSSGEPRVELRPANSTMESMWHPPHAVDIQGLVVGLMRRF
ncbi:MAG: transcriptional repressor LexA [Bdellovibrionales bacterium]